MNSTPRAVLAACSLALVSLTLASCSGGTNVPLPVLTATAAPANTPAPTSATLPLSTTPQTSTLPALAGSTASVSLATVAGAPAGASVSVAVSASPPAGAVALASAGRAAQTLRMPQAIVRTVLAYYAFTSSTTVTLNAFPTFVFASSSVPAGTSVHEAYLDGSTATPIYTLDLASGPSGSPLVSSTGKPPTLIAGKIYIFAFYIEQGTGATPAPLPTVAATPTPVPTTAPTAGATPTPAPASAEITIPASITGAAGQFSVTDPTFFNGFAGTHRFGRGGYGSKFATKTLITDCTFTIANGNAIIAGGGKSLTVPLISDNSLSPTQVFGFANKTQLINLFTKAGDGMGIAVANGVITAISGGSAADNPNIFECGVKDASSVYSDRSLDTLTFPATYVAALKAKAGTASVFTVASPTAADLGGASGTVVLGHGTILRGSVTSSVSDCTLTLAGASMTLASASGGFTSTATFGAASSSIQIVSIPTETQYNFLAGNFLMQVNDFGFVFKVSAQSGLDSMQCP